ncbi:TetR/AcrR family transcriptional regulator [Falsigemmobacter faecalis]|uniref:TetR/AcrR family transcriptional regulator n=1 Tax=Falsigemmobacter faecalis TaxID=2488730 RepID=A0A3P3DTV2_9RHOB|nr:TetR/AcrR family transcriptional regulator [Falsigemmobacter faecalis]RRH76138.1 TetR/AcrR family transcriptional regulator [Falsigemmobacter faecalis]
MEVVSGRAMRRRGIERVNLLLDATEKLLELHTDEDISLAQIAEAAEVPLPSVYHFFPNRNAAFEALALRFNEEIYRNSIEPFAEPLPETWQELLARKHARAAAFQNSRPAALRLFLGAGVSVAIRAADFSGNARIARSRARLFAAYFHMPYIENFPFKLETAASANEGIWSLSYGRHGYISEELRREGTAMAVSYLRRFLPEVLIPKVPTQEELAALEVAAEPAILPEKAPPPAA